MARLTREDFRTIRDFGNPPPSVFVETGTFEGRTVRNVAPLFETIHSIEISTKLYHNLLQQQAPADCPGDIFIHRGDSAVMVPALAVEIGEPVLWFLDAHWFNTGTPDNRGVEGRNAFPLWVELEAIAARPQPDIVVVDDVHAFGRPVAKAKRLHEEWENVTQKSILNALSGDGDRVLRSDVFGDAFVVYRSAE